MPGEEPRPPSRASKVRWVSRRGISRVACRSARPTSPILGAARGRRALVITAGRFRPHPGDSDRCANGSCGFSGPSGAGGTCRRPGTSSRRGWTARLREGVALLHPASWPRGDGGVLCPGRLATDRATGACCHQGHRGRRVPRHRSGRGQGHGRRRAGSVGTEPAFAGDLSRFREARARGNWAGRLVTFNWDGLRPAHPQAGPSGTGSHPQVPRRPAATCYQRLAGEGRPESSWSPRVGFFPASTPRFAVGRRNAVALWHAQVQGDPPRPPPSGRVQPLRTCSICGRLGRARLQTGCSRAPGCRRPRLPVSDPRRDASMT